MAYTDIDDPSAYFQTKLYTGTNNELVLTFDGNSDLQTDMIWTKNRSRASTNHVLSDTVRGIGKGLYPDLTNVEGDTNYVSAISSDGYTIVATDSVEINRLNDTFVSWNWKAGTSFTNDASSTGIGSIDSAGSFNNDAGFSIVSFVGTGSNATVKHGLNSAPAWIIFKDRSASKDWFVYHQSISPATGQKLNSTANPSADSTYFQNTAPTSSVFSIGNANTVNASSNNMIAYCFAEKKGYSKFGSYTGNGNADGTFIYTGFKPAFLIVKNTTESGNGWQIFDNKRDPFNLADGRMFANSNAAEDTDVSFDVLSNGIKMRQSFGSKNKAANVYIYMAFAENPFVTSTKVPATAR